MAPGLDLVDGQTGSPDTVIGVAESPNTGARLGDLAATAPDRVDAALAAADSAWACGDGDWSSATHAQRLPGLLRLAAELDARADSLAVSHAAEIGIPISTARLFAGGVAGVVEEIAAAAEGVLAPRPLDAGERRVVRLRLPLGPAALMGSWNAPGFTAATKIGNALAAGCPVIYKPSEVTPQSTATLVEALVAADLGPGTAQVVCGGADVGQQLAASPHVRFISYTGGSAGGRAVAATAIGRMISLQLELSGANPALVMPGADLDEAARELARGATVLNGQWCEAPRRVFVPAGDHDRLVELLLQELRGHTIGDSLEPTTTLGPLAYRGHFERVTQQLRELAAQGEATPSHDELPAEGFFLSPTVVSGLPLDAVKHEIFGPVLAVIPYTSLPAALQAANGLGDGLAGYVFGRDRDAAFALGSRLHAGEVRVGGARVLDLAPGSAQSFWGTSGIGGHGRDEVLEAHLGTRVVGEEDFTLAL
ncbi:MAG TPA: aldehyde dehydrogenase family protein [Solirubrobacterales bacterium]|jgi:phenylacetaldehyde dehydrogenase|nr:aldehyde dehydrogenase family protein [Solirubrobacterales bacterium]